MTIMMIDFELKQQLAWLNYNVALSSLSSRTGRVQGLYPSSPPSYPLNLVGDFDRGGGRWWIYGVNSAMGSPG